MNKASSFKTKLIGHKPEAGRINRNTLSCLTFPDSRLQTRKKYCSVSSEQKSWHPPYNVPVFPRARDLASFNKLLRWLNPGRGTIPPFKDLSLPTYRNIFLVLPLPPTRPGFGECQSGKRCWHSRDGQMSPSIRADLATKRVD